MLLRGEGFNLKQPYVHPNGKTYTQGWIHAQADEAAGSVSLLLEPAIRDYTLATAYAIIHQDEPAAENVIIEIPVEQLGEKMPYVAGGIYAT